MRNFQYKLAVHKNINYEGMSYSNNIRHHRFLKHYKFNQANRFVDTCNHSQDTSQIYKKWRANYWINGGRHNSTI